MRKISPPPICSAPAAGSPDQIELLGQNACAAPEGLIDDRDRDRDPSPVDHRDKSGIRPHDEKHGLSSGQSSAQWPGRDAVNEDASRSWHRDPQPGGAMAVLQAHSQSLKAVWWWFGLGWDRSHRGWQFGVVTEAVRPLRALSRNRPQRHRRRRRSRSPILCGPSAQLSCQRPAAPDALVSEAGGKRASSTAPCGYRVRLSWRRLDFRIQ